MLALLLELFSGPHHHNGLGNEPESCSNTVRGLPGNLDVEPLFAERVNPWEIFYALHEARVLIENRLREYNVIRLHDSLECRRHPRW